MSFWAQSEASNVGIVCSHSLPLIQGQRQPAMTLVGDVKRTGYPTQSPGPRIDVTAVRLLVTVRVTE
jgi:hypothetical protein